MGREGSNRVSDLDDLIEAEDPAKLRRALCMVAQAASGLRSALAVQAIDGRGRPTKIIVDADMLAEAVAVYDTTIVMLQCLMNNISITRH